jgi:hypothetical protein
MVGDVDALGDTNLSMVLAAMVEDLFSDQNLIDCHPPQPLVGRNDSEPVFFDRARDADRRLVSGDKPDARRAAPVAVDPRDIWVGHRESHESQNDRPFLFLLIDAMGA